ncbi:hypothetical protein QEG73_13985 [Chitinophagaceae bacterium 26-R-25]|nr:hypothetical protein [Chitinophagaceae bacterium 26-R-25]
MKKLTWLLSCALMAIAITSCQKDISQDSPDQTAGTDTLPKRIAYTEKNSTTGQTQNVIADYTFSKGKIIKFAANWGDTLSAFTYDDKGNLTSYIDKASYLGVLFQTDTYKISYGTNSVSVEDTWADMVNGGGEVSTTTYVLQDSLIVGAAMDLGGHEDLVTYTYNTDGNVIKEVHSYRSEVRTYTYDMHYKNPFLIRGNLLFSAINGGDGGSISVNMPATETIVYNDDNGVQQTYNLKFTVNEHIGSYPTKVHSDGPTTDDYVITYNL